MSLNKEQIQHDLISSQNGSKCVDWSILVKIYRDKTANNDYFPLLDTF